MREGKQGEGNHIPKESCGQSHKQHRETYEKTFVNFVALWEMYLKPEVPANDRDPVLI